MQRTLIIGGTGYLGRNLAKRFNPETTRIMARNEGKLVEMKNEGYEIQIGDIADPCSVRKAMQGMEKVYVLSAVKGVDIAERNPLITCETNIVGLMNVMKTALYTKPHRIIFISSDKASQVSGVYGATKLIGEKIMKEMSEYMTQTKFTTIRYGNVWGSTGSVIEKWKTMIEKGERTILVTNPDMTRFFWKVEDAIDSIFRAEKEESGSLVIPKMKSARMGDIAEAFKTKYGVNPITIGERGGENLHETLDGKIYSNEVERFTIEELIKMI